MLPHGFLHLNLLLNIFLPTSSPISLCHSSAFKTRLKDPLLGDVHPCTFCIMDSSRRPFPRDWARVFWGQDRVLFIVSTQDLVHVIHSVNTDQNYELMSNICCHKITNCSSKVSDSCLFALKLVKETPHLTLYLQYKYIYILFIYIYMVYICIYINMYIYILLICFIYYISYKYISMYPCQGET